MTHGERHYDINMMHVRVGDGEDRDDMSEKSPARCICVCLGVQTERRVLYMVMREEWRQNRGLVHRKCQTFNKNKVAGRAPITNSLNSRQTNPPQESRAGGVWTKRERGEED